MTREESMTSNERAGPHTGDDLPLRAVTQTIGRRRAGEGWP